MLPQFIFGLTLISLNVDVTLQAPQEAMHFGGTLNRLIKRILAAYPRLGPIYLIKVDLVDAYMCLWVHGEDTPATAFIIPKNK